MSTVVGTFKDMAEAQRVVAALTDAGYSTDQISLVASDTDGRYQEWVRNDVDVDDDVTGGEGALVGGVEGGVIGFLVGLGALAIPGIGPIVAMGPLLGGLVGAGVGAVTGGLVASLVNLGVPETAADTYAEAARRGYVLVIVNGLSEAKIDNVEDIMDLYDVVDIDERNEYWQNEGWTGYDPEVEAFTPADYERERISLTDPYDGYDMYYDDFYNHYNTNYAHTSYVYEDYDPAYRFGYLLGTDPQYNSYMTWNDLEPIARRDWQTRDQGAWEDFKDSVRYAWERVKMAITT